MTDRPTGDTPRGELPAHDVPAADLATVLTLVEGLRPGVVNVGHGHDPASRARARAFCAAWARRGEQVGAVVSWPAAAASWLRPATRLADDVGEVWSYRHGLLVLGPPPAAPTVPAGATAETAGRIPCSS